MMNKRPPMVPSPNHPPIWPRPSFHRPGRLIRPLALTTGLLPIQDPQRFETHLLFLKLGLLLPDFLLLSFKDELLVLALGLQINLHPPEVKVLVEHGVYLHSGKRGHSQRPFHPNKS